jgi:hypothetical protein
MWKLIAASVVMLQVTLVKQYLLIALRLWGGISGVAYFYIVYEIWAGSAKN